MDEAAEQLTLDDFEELVRLSQRQREEGGLPEADEARFQELRLARAQLTRDDYARLSAEKAAEAANPRRVRAVSAADSCAARQRVSFPNPTRPASEELRSKCERDPPATRLELERRAPQARFSTASRQSRGTPIRRARPRTRGQRRDWHRYTGRRGAFRVRRAIRGAVSPARSTHLAGSRVGLTRCRAPRIRRRP